MGDYGKKMKNVVSYDDKVTLPISQALLVCSLSVPLLLCLVSLGFYDLTTEAMMSLAVSLLIVTTTPYIMYKLKVPSSIIKYCIPIMCSIIIAIYAIMPGIEINLAYLLGIAVAAIYLDSKLLLVTGGVSYILMMVSSFMNTMGVFFVAKERKLTFMEALQKFEPRGLSLTIEFTVIFFALMTVCYFSRKHLMTEDDLLLELSTEEERYRLAFEGSKDVIFDYFYETGRFSYYGSLVDKNVSNSEEHVIEHAFSMLSSGALIHYDDIPKVLDLITGKSGDSVVVRLCDKEPGEYIWIRIDCSIVKKGSKNIRAVGKITDITDEKNQEENFLKMAVKDSTTGFYTWEIGEELLDRLEENEEGNIYFLYFKILNLDAIIEQYGSFFSDAIISRIAEITRAILREDDYLFRINTETFAAVLVDVDEDMLTMIHSSLERSLEHIYTGGTDVEGLDYIVRYIKERPKFEQLIAGESSKQIISGRKSGELDYEAVSFTFNILEHSRDLPSSMMMLLEHIGDQFNIMSIHILELDDTPGIETCLYEWSSMPGGRRLKAGERRDSDVDDLEEAYEILRKNEYLVIDTAYMSRLSNESKARLSANHTSHFIVPIYSGGEIYGAVDYEHLNVDYVWPEVTKSTLMEITRCMSTYILRDRADFASRAKSDFLSSISHEVRTPLNAISGFSELLLAKDDIDDEVRKYAGGIKGSADNLLSVISGILDFSKIESGDVDILKEKFRLSDMLFSLYQMIVAGAEEKGLELNINFEGRVPDGLIGDGQRIKQVLINLLSNAIKFTNSGRVDLNISFKFADDNEGLLYADVKDTGIGIKQEVIDTIFDSFQYADKTKNKSIKGVGLGLSISRNLLHLMKGDIGCTSEYGKGSTFSISVPLKVYDESEAFFNPEYLKERDDDVFRIPFVCPDARVLIVDDNKVNLEVAKGLIGQYQADITAVMSGDEALNVFFREHNFDIIFMDHMMPKMDGIECTNHLRKLDVEGAAEVPIVALTANAVKDARKMFISAGMDDYIAKPINLEELAEIMNRWIPGKYKKEPEAFIPGKARQAVKNPEASQPEVSHSVKKQENTEPAGEYDVLKGIDYKSGMKNVMDSPEIYKELLETFIDSDSISDAEKFFADRNLEDYRISVHGLKSSARYIGAAELSDKSKELEDLARDGNWEGIEREHPVLVPMYKEVADSIKLYLGESKKAEENNSSSEDAIERDELKNRLEDILDMLRDMDYDAAGDMVSRLKHVSYTDEAVQDEIDEIIHMIDNFDFEEAEERLTALIAWGFSKHGD
ncbi:MAG: response regulator [Lachnospiraceae bacterium]|nr:response regulator [Lachnospiraceae bacterium]